jgi:hypothetical protein
VSTTVKKLESYETNKEKIEKMNLATYDLMENPKYSDIL